MVNKFTKDRLMSSVRATSNNLRLTIMLLLHARLVIEICNRGYVASKSLVAQRCLIMELDRRTNCNCWTLSATPNNGMNEVRKIPRCRYLLNHPSVESLDEKSHNGHRLIELFRTSIDWRNCVDLQCWTIQVDTVSFIAGLIALWQHHKAFLIKT